MTSQQVAAVIRSRALFIRNSDRPVVVRPLSAFHRAVLAMNHARAA